jgi:hypothetical protein
VLVIMPVMQIGVVRVFVHQLSVAVQVAVWLAYEIAWRMHMLVMRVMEMAVLMFQGLVHMLVVVRLCQMQINADPHQQRSAEERNGQWLAE